MAQSFQVLRNTMEQHMGDIKTSVTVFATDDCRDGAADARAWLKEKGLTPDQVRLFRHNGQVLVETIRPVFIPPPHRLP